MRIFGLIKLSEEKENAEGRIRTSEGTKPQDF
jgi:hypothetical protein